MSEISVIEITDIGISLTLSPDQVITATIVNDDPISVISIAEQGLPGVGIPTGGTTGQVLAKIDGSDYNTEWVDQGGGGGSVDSVNGQTGIVVLDQTDIGLGNVDNTSDLDKPVSTETQTALNLKQDSLGFTPENLANKEDSTLDNSATKYPTNNLVKNSIDNSQLWKRTSTTLEPKTYGDVVKASSVDFPMAAGGITKPIVSFGSGTFSVTSMDCFLFSNSNNSGKLQKFTISELLNQPISDNIYYYLMVSYNSGSPIYTLTTDNTVANHSDIIQVAQIIHEIYGLIDEYKVFYVGNYGLGLSNKISHRLIHTQRFGYESGLMLGETGTRYVTTTPGVIWYDGEEIQLGATNSNIIQQAHFYYHVGGVWTASFVPSYNNTQFDNGTNLATLAGGKYAVNWVYRSVLGGHDECYIVLGGGDYNLAEAQASKSPSNLPSIISKACVLVGRIIVKKNDPTAIQIDSAFIEQFSSSGIFNHNDASGLQGGQSNEYYHLTALEHTGTGTGPVARQTSPVLTTPDIGTARFDQIVGDKDIGSVATKTVRMTGVVGPSATGTVIVEGHTDGGNGTAIVQGAGTSDGVGIAVLRGVGGATDSVTADKYGTWMQGAFGEGFGNFNSDLTIFSYTIENIIFMTTGISNKTVTLPDSNGSTYGSISGRELLIKKEDSGSGSIIIVPFPTNTINGQSLLTLRNQGDYVRIICVGSGDWKIISRNQPVYLGQGVVDFGSFPGSNQASLTISGQTDILTSSNVSTKIAYQAQGDFNADEIGFLSTLIGLSVSPVNVGDGFIIVANSVEKLQGQIPVSWVWQ